MAFLAGKRALIIGLATERSIAYGIAQALKREGAELAFSYQERFKDRVEGMGQVFWDFAAGPVAFTLHLDRDRGIAVIASDTSPAAEALLKNMAERLRTLREDTC